MVLAGGSAGAHFELLIDGRAAVRLSISSWRWDESYSHSPWNFCRMLT